MAKKKKKLNCWDFKGCRRQVSGLMTGEFGICPASIDNRLHGIHGGMNAGRSCWVVAGTMCENGIQGTFASKFRVCSSCEFYRLVKEQEGKKFVPPDLLLKRL